MGGTRLCLVKWRSLEACEQKSNHLLSLAQWRMSHRGWGRRWDQEGLCKDLGADRPRLGTWDGFSHQPGWAQQGAASGRCPVQGRTQKAEEPWPSGFVSLQQSWVICKEEECIQLLVLEVPTS